ncbi:hypothetical protein BGZ76_003997 [Entomortierella beljakovae]|nr:hypothetical protein BGZ76_003997 [Entomortierella beljakovae]
MPSNFRSVPDTERIEGIEKQAAQQFFIKKLGTSTVTNDCFSIKAARMPFREPPAREIPPFVQKAIIEHEYATAKYNEDLLEYEQWRIGNSSKEETVDPSNPPMTKSLIRKPEPPMKPPFLVQHELRSVRQYPSSIDSSHPSFRVTFIIAKKTISKLAVHRNLCRKKLSAAVETVFRKHARRGNEFMIFAKKPCVTTPQWKLNELMKEALSNSRLYGDRSSRIADTESNSSENGDTVTSDRGLPKIRWKNNRPPAHREWWRHALPNPLGRIQQTNSFLDQYCPKDERPAEFNKNQNPRKID